MEKNKQNPKLNKESLSEDTNGSDDKNKSEEKQRLKPLMKKY